MPFKEYPEFVSELPIAEQEVAIVHVRLSARFYKIALRYGETLSAIYVG